MTEAQTAWVAGIVEGEGSISWVGKQGVRVKVAMTDEDVVRRLLTYTGVGTVGGPYDGTNKPRWSWYVGAKEDVWWLLMALLPWFGERRTARAIEAIERAATPKQPVKLGAERTRKAGV